MRCAVDRALSGRPSFVADNARLKEYESGPTAKLAEQIMKGFASATPENADVSEVARAIIKVVDLPLGTRQFRIHIDPAQDGAEIVNAVTDRVFSNRSDKPLWVQPDKPDPKRSCRE